MPTIRSLQVLLHTHEHNEITWLRSRDPIRLFVGENQLDLSDPLGPPLSQLGPEQGKMLFS